MSHLQPLSACSRRGMGFIMLTTAKVGQGNGASIERGKSLEILVTWDILVFNRQLFLNLSPPR